MNHHHRHTLRKGSALLKPRAGPRQENGVAPGLSPFLSLPRTLAESRGDESSAGAGSSTWYIYIDGWTRVSSGGGLYGDLHALFSLLDGVRRLYIYIYASLSEISDDAFLTSHFFLSLSGANDAAQQIAPRSKNHGWDARFVDARG